MSDTHLLGGTASGTRSLTPYQ